MWWTQVALIGAQIAVFAGLLAYRRRLVAQLRCLEAEHDEDWESCSDVIRRDRQPYCCPVCFTHNPNAYIACSHPMCPDGRDPR